MVTQITTFDFWKGVTLFWKEIRYVHLSTGMNIGVLVESFYDYIDKPAIEKWRTYHSLRRLVFAAQNMGTDHPSWEELRILKSGIRDGDV